MTVIRNWKFWKFPKRYLESVTFRKQKKVAKEYLDWFQVVICSYFIFLFVYVSSKKKTKTKTKQNKTKQKKRNSSKQTKNVIIFNYWHVRLLLLFNIFISRLFSCKVSVNVLQVEMIGLSNAMNRSYIWMFQACFDASHFPAPPSHIAILIVKVLVFVGINN